MGSLWRRMKPNCWIDTLSIIYAQIMIHSGLVYGEFMVLPWLIETYKVGLVKICLYHMYAIFIYFNVIGRMWKICSTNTSTVGKILPTLLKPGWYYCTICEANSPPRAFHCRTCNKCILKRDHHCMFTGKCIGYFNYGHYLLLVFYVWLGTMFAVVMGFEFTWSYVLGGFSFWSVIYFIFPLICFVTGQLSFYTSAASFLCLLASVFFILLTFLMIYHAKHVYYGQVTYERTHKIYAYDLGWKVNFISVFGSKWHISWIFPTIESPLPGDGIEFVRKENYESPKTM
ncbi:probable palmitoyltransferase ZDHHC24 [Pecten maximus]|uniref:probable palmitoyltransferase ZDHHC24 n=1 Tax=Pecten maximus TaxID=6579 RepID=UPI001458E81A|nr:probable palmitoyltransferase ZDHHC24 [Pecten maximus]